MLFRSCLGDLVVMEMEYASFKDSSFIKQLRTVPLPTPLGPLIIINKPFFMSTPLTILTFILLVQAGYVKRVSVFFRLFE